MKDNSAINIIISKVITGEELTSTERAMYDEYLASEGSRELVERMTNKEYQLLKMKEYHRIDVKEGKAVIDQKLASGKRISISKHRNLFRDVATSAAAVLLLAAAIFFWLNRKSDKNTVVKEEVKMVAQKDVAPGTTSASLTLADGSKVVLDSTTTGQLAQQGGAVVVNEKGTLTYQGKLEAQQEVLYNTLSTVNAQTYAMVLADGSKVWLNTGASIRYPVAFTGNERKVEITGEVYFEVAHNINKPFIVHVLPSTGGRPGMDVQVLGTHFNINAYHDEAVIKTTLLEGSVQIKLNNYQTLLKPGQQSQVGNGIPQVIDSVNVDAVVAWKNGRFNFENADFDAVMRQVTKWYDIEVVYEGPKPVQTAIGQLDRNVPLLQVTEALEALYYASRIHFRIEGRKLIVSAPATDDPHKRTIK